MVKKRFQICPIHLNFSSLFKFSWIFTVRLLDQWDHMALHRSRPLKFDIAQILFDRGSQMAFVERAENEQKCRNPDSVCGSFFPSHKFFLSFLGTKWGHFWHSRYLFFLSFLILITKACRILYFGLFTSRMGNFYL